MNTIRTNKINASFDYGQIDSKYDFYKIISTGKYIKRGSYVLDSQEMSSRILSIVFDDHKTVYIMFVKDSGNKEILSAVLKSNNDDTLSFSKELSSQIPKHILFQLFLNSLNNYEHDYLRFNNITGHLFCTNSSWKEQNKKTNDTKQIKTINVVVDENMLIHLDVRTFTNGRYKKSLGLSDKQYKELPKYQLTEFNGLKRKNSSDNSPEFVLRQFTNEKNEVPFLDIKNINTFKSSKMGVLAEVVTNFEKRYGEMASISLETRSVVNQLYSKPKDKAAYQKEIIEVAKSCRIRIIDMINDKKSAELCEKIKEKLNSDYKINAELGKRPIKEAFNICLIHNADYYENDDPHNHSDQGKAIQHITEEDYKFNNDAALLNVLKELVIKQDIIDHKMTLFNWNSLNLNDDMLVCIEEKCENTSKYHFLKISRSGDLDFFDREPTLFANDTATRIIRKYEMYADKKETCRAVIYVDNTFACIVDSGLFTIPDYAEIVKELKNGNTNIRGLKMRELLMSGVLDIRLIDDGHLSYYVGVMGYGMKTNVNSASHIRRIDFDGESDISTLILKLLNVFFVRHGQFAVMPFPIKYINEYIKKIA